VRAAQIGRDPQPGPTLRTPHCGPHTADPAPRIPHPVSANIGLFWSYIRTGQVNMLQISENAGKLINKMTARQGIPSGGLRIGVKAGGCSGLSYTFAWEPAPRDGDHVFEGPDGSKVYVDPKSHRFIDGTTLDYDTSLVSKGFIFNNPNAKASCGCGTSFSV
jgi:iron-sulfur cluster assembly protein